MRRLARGVAAVALFALACALDAPVTSAASTRNVARLVASFNEPVYLAAPNRGRRLFVVERAGRIRVIRGGKVRKRPFLDISDDVITSAQRGLWSMAFAPDYARTGRFYVMYAATDDTVQLDEFQRSDNPDRARLSSRRPVLNVGVAGPYHHGGQLQFGPDGLLYISTGVSSYPRLAQDLGDLHGKMLRLDPRAAGGLPYTVPADNPFVAVPELDQRSGPLVCAIRGDSHSIGPRGTSPSATSARTQRRRSTSSLAPTRQAVNFGFDIFEGTQQMLAGAAPPRYVPPAIEHRHNQPRTRCGSIGGYVRPRPTPSRPLRALRLQRPLRGDAPVGGPRARKRPRRSAARLRIPSVVSFGEDGRGRLYGIDIVGGVYRLEPRRPPPSQRPNRDAGRGATHG